MGIEITRQHGAALAAALSAGAAQEPNGAPLPDLDAIFVPVGGGSLLMFVTLSALYGTARLPPLRTKGG